MWNSNCEEKEEENYVSHFEKCRYVLPSVLTFSHARVKNLAGLSWWQFGYHLRITLNRIWPLRAADLWRGSQDATFSEENTGSDWSPGSWEAKPEEQTYCHEPSAIWNHCTLWVWQMAVTALSALALYVLTHFTSSHISATKRRGEGWSELLLCYTGGDRERHQGEPLPGARRVRRKPLWHQDGLDSWSGDCRPHLHPGCQPSGWLQIHAV